MANCTETSLSPKLGEWEALIHNYIEYVSRWQPPACPERDN